MKNIILSASNFAKKNYDPLFFIMFDVTFHQKQLYTYSYGFLFLSLKEIGDFSEVEVLFIIIFRGSMEVKKKNK